MSEQPIAVLVHGAFAADVDFAQTSLMAVTQRPVTQAALWEGLPTTEPAWNFVPSRFVFGDHDLNIPVGLHRFMAQRVGSMGTTEIAGGSHAISVSHPDAVVATILDAVAGVGVFDAMDASLL
jgi:pimeloyl-ACP methyl ester carboxylesterase